MLTLKQFTEQLKSCETLSFMCNSTAIPEHFHITELAFIEKQFIDCGWTKRHETFISMQIWVAEDKEHRLSPDKLLKIIDLWKWLIPDENIPLVFEYQWFTLETYNIDYDGDNFILEPIYTNCLAQDKCGIKPDQLPKKNSCCGGSCC